MPGLENQNKAIVMRKQTIMIEKPLMQLKDYLVDDLSSCSSNGFKSFPRKRQCCTTVRFLLEIDLKQKDIIRSNDSDRVLRRSRSKTASERLSALLRASDAVINAVKHLPYRRLFMSRFWGKSDGRKGRKRLDHCGPFDRNTESAMTRDKGWWESEFGNVPSFSEKNDMSLGEGNSNKLDKATVGDDSCTEAETTTVKEWSNEEEKEQFSPVSILDCPFEDDDNYDQTSSSNYNHKLVSLEGTKQNIRRFENLAKIEPIDLEKRITMSELENNNKLPSTTISIRKDDDFDGKRDESEEKARVLVKLVKGKNSYLCSKADNLMLDFFEEKAIEDSNVVKVKEALKVMEDWLSNGEEREVWFGWEVKEGRNAYVNEMEKGGKWKRFDLDKEEVGLDLEASIWESLVNEIFII